MAKLTISLAQINVVQGDVRKNTQLAEEAITDAAKRGSHLIMLPELWSTGYALQAVTADAIILVAPHPQCVARTPVSAAAAL